MTPVPLTIGQIDHVVLYAADVNASAAFYRRALGLCVERTLETPVLVQLRAGNALLDLTERPKDWPGPSPINHVAFGVEASDLEPLRQHLLKLGATPDTIKRRYGAKGFGPSFTFADPDGNIIEIKGVNPST